MKQLQCESGGWIPELSLVMHASFPTNHATPTSRQLIFFSSTNSFLQLYYLQIMPMPARVVCELPSLFKFTMFSGPVTVHTKREGVPGVSVSFPGYHTLNQSVPSRMDSAFYKSAIHYRFISFKASISLDFSVSLAFKSFVLCPSSPLSSPISFRSNSPSTCRTMY
jgi:hypothetical protein